MPVVVSPKKRVTLAPDSPLKDQRASSPPPAPSVDGSRPPSGKPPGRVASPISGDAALKAIDETWRAVSGAVGLGPQQDGVKPTKVEDDVVLGAP